MKAQLELQKKHQWDINEDVDWDQPIDLSRFFLPLDDLSIAFPGASSRQRLLLSQLMGLVVNATISEMEVVATSIRDVGWRQILDSYPVGPEMYELGEQFFAEETKHSELFQRFNLKFCHQIEIEPKDLQMLLPNSFGAFFHKIIKANALRGGHAFWWVVAVVEEVSVLLYRNVHRDRRAIDPLFYQIHRKHFEEESRHTSYAFLMLDLIAERAQSFERFLFRKFDLLVSEIFSTSWVLTELYKVKRLRQLKGKHPFFTELADTLPLLEKLPLKRLLKTLFVRAPYISLVLNQRYHRLSQAAATKHGAFKFRYPAPEPQSTYVDDASGNEGRWQAS